MSGKRSRYYTRAKRGEVDEPDHVPNAAERVFNTPYVARQIVQWAGLSGVNARLITPGIPRLERSDPAFRAETRRILDDLRPKIVHPAHWWDPLKIVYEDANGRVRRSEQLNYALIKTGRTREETLSNNLHVRVFDEEGNLLFYATDDSDVNEVADVKHRATQNGNAVETFNAPNPGADWTFVGTSPGPYIKKNQSLRPDLWLPLIRDDAPTAGDGTLNFD